MSPPRIATAGSPSTGLDGSTRATPCWRPPRSSLLMAIVLSYSGRLAADASADSSRQAVHLINLNTVNEPAQLAGCWRPVFPGARERRVRRDESLSIPRVTTRSRGKPAQRGRASRGDGAPQTARPALFSLVSSSRRSSRSQSFARTRRTNSTSSSGERSTSAVSGPLRCCGGHVASEGTTCCSRRLIF